MEPKDLPSLENRENHLDFTPPRLILGEFLNAKYNKRDPSSDVNKFDLYAGDDCISIVSGSSDIRIKNITCGPGHGIRCALCCTRLFIVHTVDMCYTRLDKVLG